MAAGGATPKVILWDVMDTLVRDPFFTHLPGFFGMSFQELLARKHPSAWAEFELGKLAEHELFARFFQDGTPVDGPGLKACMMHAYEFLEGIEPLLAELKARGVLMHALSNYPSWYRLIDERLGLSRYLELSFISCRTGVRKPAQAAFLGAARALGLAPAECLFVDDREVNCAAARVVGMPSVHFRGEVASLRGELQAHGLL